MSTAQDKVSALRSTADNPDRPPCSPEAESSVIGGLLLDAMAWDQVIDVLSAADFYIYQNQTIFICIQELQEENQNVDALTVSERLKQNNQLDRIGGVDYITNIVRTTPSSANIKSYAEIVRNKSILRRLLSVSSEIATTVRNPDGASTKEILDHAERSVYGIYDETQGQRDGFKMLKDLMPDIIDRLDVLSKSDDEITGVPSGFTELDNYTAGLQKGDFIVIAGRPSMGKTSFAMNIAENAAIGHNIPVGIFSMEMSSDQLSIRMLSSIGRVNQSRLKTGNLNGEDWSRVNSAGTILSEAPIWVDDLGSLSPLEIRARARRLKREHNIGLIIIDYIQLMSVGGFTENRATEVSAISRSLKALAKELDLPIIALSQLNRGIELRADKRPQMSDLRESGAIEQDADVIVFIYRDEVYNKDSPKKGIADIVIAKQRNGPIGDFCLTFLGEYTKFENYLPDAYGDGIRIL